MQQADYDRVLSWLRGAEHSGRVAFIGRWSLHTPVITGLATSAVNDPDEALSIVRTAFEGITHADSQLTKHWCRFAVTKLGPRKTLRVLRDYFVSRPHVVDMACYWLPTMIGRQDSAFPGFQALVRDADSAGIIRPAVTSAGPGGKQLFHDRYADTDTGS
jgi:hypothetical protein